MKTEGVILKVDVERAIKEFMLSLPYSLELDLAIVELEESLQVDLTTWKETKKVKE